MVPLVLRQQNGSPLLPNTDTMGGTYIRIQITCSPYGDEKLPQSDRWAHPEGLGAKKVMENALEDAGMEKADIEYINVHGTGQSKMQCTLRIAERRIDHVTRQNWLRERISRNRRFSQIR